MSLQRSTMILDIDEALSRDPASLSYTYDLGPDMRLLMLDSCQYSPTNKVWGMIKTETYDWIDDQLDEAWDDGVILLPVAHHNLLDESKIYDEDCTIEHSEETGKPSGRGKCTVVFKRPSPCTALYEE